MDDYNKQTNNLENTPNHGDTLNDEETSAPKNVDTPGSIATYSDRDEETAAEFTAEDYRSESIDSEDEDTSAAGAAFGWTAIALAIASYFWLPIILGGAGIIVGFVARNRNAETLGNIAIAAGVISILITLFIIPFI